MRQFFLFSIFRSFHSFFKPAHLALVFCLCLFGLSSFSPLLAQPAGFSDQTYVGGFVQGVGLTFDANNRMYVWEKGGKVWIVENGAKLSTPLLDISEEVGNWRDFGMLGLALDPNFLTNGYIYLLYLVDRHHLLNFGTGSYNAATNEYYAATIGRITRYTAEASTNFKTVDYSSRLVLLGATANDGFPSLHQSHGIGQLIFGTDGSLLASFGDGASYSSVDEGSASETYYIDALADGIIPATHNVGAYRSQLLDSYAGKILRLDPATGHGLPSNPFWTGTATDPESKVWARGLRNPCRITLRPGTGSHNPGDGNPGVIYIGDVGWGNREELDVVDAAGQNLGWPKYEGITHQPGYNNATYTPSTHTVPKVDWRNGTPRATINGTTYNVGSVQVPGPSFGGNCAIGGVWYTGTDFPVEYQNTYFHCDYGANWIKNFGFDANNNPIFVKDFKAGANNVIFVATSPVDGSLYYIGGASGAGTSTASNEVRRIVYGDNNLNPVAVAKADVMYGSSPLTVNFKGNQSYDPESRPITYSWDFGDGSSLDNNVNPSHTFTASSASPESFTVTLTVTDDETQTDQMTLLISLNNTPPVINSTSLDAVHTFSMAGQTNQSLTAVVTDAEHGPSELTYAWQTYLYHDNHNHPEPVDYNKSTSTIISPVGCDEVLYFYRVFLTVTDDAGLSSMVFRDIFPDCGGPISRNDSITFLPGQANVLNVLANDLANGGTIAPGTVNILQQPANGTAAVNAGTGEITYTHDGSNSTEDRIIYEVENTTGDASNPALVLLSRGGPPTAVINNPQNNAILAGTEVQVIYESLGTLSGDESVLLTLDGGAPIQLFSLSGAYTFTGLSFGNHTVVMQLADLGGTPLTPPEASTSVNFVSLQAGGGTGLRATYYDNIDFTGSTLVRIDPEVDFNWGTGSPDPAIGADTYSARWSGYIQSLYSETYTFSANTDDGFRLWVDGEQVINSWINQAPTVHAGTKTMIAGQKVPIVVEYYENGGGAVAELSWSSTNQGNEIIPEEFLFPYDCTNAFSDGFELEGDAQNGTESQCFDLTSATNLQAGAMWFNHKLDLSQPFGMTFNITAGGADAGADGMSFLLQRSGDEKGAIGAGGGGLGASGITPSFGVEIDTYQGGGELADDHIAIFSNGNLASPLVAAVCADKDCQNIEDGAEHQLILTWNPTSNTFEVFWDRSLRATYTGDIVSTIFSNDPMVYFGFTAATGGANNQHTVCVAQLSGQLDPTTFPIELLRFDASPEEDQVALSWETANEQNSAYFLIERAGEDQNFATIAQVDAAGYSFHTQTYGNIDPTPISGVSYYRLKLVDLDGSFAYSQTVRIFLERDMVSVVPNPVKVGQELQIWMRLMESQSVKLSLMSMHGQLVHQSTHEVRAGQEHLPILTYNLARGVYLLKASAKDQSWEWKVVLR
ncbi:MAG: PA14 domain-containing protein [Bacteroidota bacterium]